MCTTLSQMLWNNNFLLTVFFIFWFKKYYLRFIVKVLEKITPYPFLFVKKARPDLSPLGTNLRLEGG